MPNRKLIAGALAAMLGVAVAPAAVDAAWNGVRYFPCYGTGANWTFDGLMGPFTERAVKQFQRERGLKVDGIVGPETMWALKLPYTRNLRCGMGGRDVLMVQHRLASLGVWERAANAPTGTSAQPSARPTAKPATPRPQATEPPMGEDTPEPDMTEAPTPEPTATEAPVTTPTPGTDSLAPRNEPTFELEAGVWSIPVSGFWYVPGVGGSATNVDWSVLRTSYVVDAGLWAGNWGVGGGLTTFNLANPSVNLGPFSQPGALMYDGLLKYRFDHGYYQVFAGYRGLNTGTNLNFGTVGVGLERPLAGEWLWLEGELQGGHNFASSYFYDGRIGLGLHAGPAALNLGFRHLGLQPGIDPHATVNGPIATVKLAF
ncbi:putative peptidoglycan binding domain protein [compost metagenome]